jgi:hypothetical protein
MELRWDIADDMAFEGYVWDWCAGLNCKLLFTMDVVVCPNHWPRRLTTDIKHLAKLRHFREMSGGALAGMVQADGGEPMHSLFSYGH